MFGNEIELAIALGNVLRIRSMDRIWELASRKCVRLQLWYCKTINFDRLRGEDNHYFVLSEIETRKCCDLVTYSAFSLSRPTLPPIWRERRAKKSPRTDLKGLGRTMPSPICSYFNGVREINFVDFAC